MWAPAEMSETSEGRLRELKIGYRAKIIKQVSDAFASGEINECRSRAMDHESIRHELLKLYGVAPDSQDSARNSLPLSQHDSPHSSMGAKDLFTAFLRPSDSAESRIRDDLTVATDRTRVWRRVTSLRTCSGVDNMSTSPGWKKKFGFRNKRGRHRVHSGSNLWIR
jgi:hypothetical protein